MNIGRTTLRRILVGAGLDSPRRRHAPKHRIRRQRMPREGMLVQTDGSHHRCLEDRGPQFTLLLAVDDATGCVASALFCHEEDTRSYFLLLEDLVRCWGVPLGLYTDRHSVFTPGIRTAKKSTGSTQFSRAMGELGVQLVLARSPHGKGRVERMAGTFQDRLVTELRLAGASSIAEANRVLRDFLPRFNEQFRVPARESEAAYRALDPETHLDRVFCFKHWRKVGRDNTLRYRWHTLQLAPDAQRTSYAGARVEVLEGLDGSLRVLHDGHIIPSQEAPPRPGTLRKLNGNVQHAPGRYHQLNGAGLHRRNGSAASIEATTVQAGVRATMNSAGNGVKGARRPAVVRRRKPDRRQRGWWKAVHQAKLRGMSTRGIARELGMSRNTVRKYLAADAPEMVGTVTRSGASPSDNMRNDTSGHNR